jgi:hypothetical protein
MPRFEAVKEHRHPFASIREHLGGGHAENGGCSSGLSAGVASAGLSACVRKSGYYVHSRPLAYVHGYLWPPTHPAHPVKVPKEPFGHSRPDRRFDCRLADICAIGRSAFTLHFESSVSRSRRYPTGRRMSTTRSSNPCASPKHRHADKPVPLHCQLQAQDKLRNLRNAVRTMPRKSSKD